MFDSWDLTVPQDHDDPHVPGPRPSDVRQGVRVRRQRPSTQSRSIAVSAHPGELALYHRLTAARPSILREPPRRRTSRVRVEPRGAADIDPTRKFKELSKGNKQKIGLVIALEQRAGAADPQPATSGLDPLVQQTLYSVVREARTRVAPSSSPAHPVRGRSHRPPRGDHPRRPPGQGRPNGSPARSRPPPGRSSS